MVVTKGGGYVDLPKKSSFHFYIFIMHIRIYKECLYGVIWLWFMWNFTNFRVFYYFDWFCYSNLFVVCFNKIYFLLNTTTMLCMCRHISPLKLEWSKSRLRGNLVAWKGWLKHLCGVGLEACFIAKINYV